MCTSKPNLYAKKCVQINAASHTGLPARFQAQNQYPEHCDKHALVQLMYTHVNV